MKQNLIDDGKKTQDQIGDYQGPEFQYDPADDERDEDDEMAEAEMNCGLRPDGQCSNAGTEYCDWVCPLGR